MTINRPVNPTDVVVREGLLAGLKKRVPPQVFEHAKKILSVRAFDVYASRHKLLREQAYKLSAALSHALLYQARDVFKVSQVVASFFPKMRADVTIYELESPSPVELFGGYRMRNLFIEPGEEPLVRLSLSTRLLFNSRAINFMYPRIGTSIQVFEADKMRDGLEQVSLCNTDVLLYLGTATTIYDCIFVRDVEADPSHFSTRMHDFCSVAREGFDGVVLPNMPQAIAMLCNLPARDRSVLQVMDYKQRTGGPPLPEYDYELRHFQRIQLAQGLLPHRRNIAMDDRVPALFRLLPNLQHTRSR